jgi:hypothetical protein
LAILIKYGTGWESGDWWSNWCMFWHRAEHNQSGCSWADLGCLLCCASLRSILIIGFHVWLSLKPTSLLKFLGCKCISMASATIRSVYVKVLLSLLFFSSPPSKLYLMACVDYVFCYSIFFWLTES